MGACFQGGELNSMEELPEFHGPPRCPLSELHAQGENEDLLLFVAPKAHWTATLNGCH